MADPQDQPERGATGIPPAPRKAQAKKAPAKKAPAKKAPAKKAPAKKATPRPALAASPAATPLTDGDSAARQAAADAKASVQKADHPAALRSSPESDYRLPISLGLAAAGLVALVLSRLRRG
jgi:hypothetical protein